MERVWLPDWLADRDAVVNRLVAAVQEASDRTVPPTVTQASEGDPTPALGPVQPMAPRTGPAPAVRDTASAPALAGTSPARPVIDAGWPGEATEFVAWPVRRLGGREVLDELPARAAGARVRAALVEVVDAEGPIHVDRLARLVAQSFDLTKLHAARRDAILHHLPRGLRCDRAETVAWPQSRDPETWTGYRPAPDGSSRPIEDVPLREIVNAMVALVRSTGGMESEELHRETLRVFGLKRRTGGAVERLGAALALGRTKSRLRRGPHGTVTAEM